ncbi:MAG: DUF373 family protein [Candidatus Bathyarchaeota archaeon]|nr:MAG: DUF373 family protein [Candidatus Bathyarchaeota archaeon]
MPESTKEESERILILCVDRDDDLGVKGEIKTPVLGRKENLNAAVSLALRDPEEPDANAMFEAVRIYDHLKEGSKTSENHQIATIAGSELGGVGADRQLVSELTTVLERFPASDVILVTDGFSDEAILPLIQSRVPVTSVRRIVVAHSESIEETAAVFSRYLKMIWENPRYSRILLGLPGTLMIILGILYITEWIQYSGIAFLIVCGTFLLIKGFRIDKALLKLYRFIREYSPPPLPIQIANYSTVAGVLLSLVGFYLGGVEAANSVPQPPPALGQWLGLLPRLVGWFISGSIALTVVGVSVVLAGRTIRWYFERDPKLWRTIVIVVAVAWSWPIFQQASQILIYPEQAGIYTVGFVATIIIGIPLTVAAVLTTFLLHRKYARFFREKKEELEEISEG